MIKVSASILNIDFTRFESTLNELANAGTDYIHFDVMDGHFVKNVSFGTPVFEAVKKISNIPLDVHLMVENPLRAAEYYLESGASVITIHAETADGSIIRKLSEKTKERGIKLGIALKPETPVSKILPYLEYAGLVLVMTVEPGQGGQGFLYHTLEKISALKKIYNGEIQVDGGINVETAEHVKKAGAINLVVGTFLMNSKNMPEAVEKLKEYCNFEE